MYIARNRDGELSIFEEKPVKTAYVWVSDKGAWDILSDDSKFPEVRKELIPKLLKQNPNLKIGVVAFGDYFDMPRKDVFGKAYQVCELTNNEAT